MRKLMTTCLASTALIALPALALAQQPAQQPGQQPPAQAQQGQQQDKQTMDFLRQAVGGNMFEIESSRLALDRTQRQDVRSFAQRMINDHEQLGERLRKAAAGMKAPQEMGKQNESALAELEKLKGENFDRRYMYHQVRAHVDSVNLFQAYAKDGRNDEMRRLAEETHPRLNEHLNMAMDLQRQIAGGPQAQAPQGQQPGQQQAGQQQPGQQQAGQQARMQEPQRGQQQAGQDWQRQQTGQQLAQDPQRPGQPGQQQPGQQQAGQQAQQPGQQAQAPGVQVTQQPPQVTVRQEQPQIIVRQAPPRITVDQPQPEIIVRMPEPQVDVATQQPEVQVRMPQPQVEVLRAQRPDQVQVQTADQPQVHFERTGEPQVEFRQAEGQPQVRFERLQPGQQAQQPGQQQPGQQAQQQPRQQQPGQQAQQQPRQQQQVTGAIPPGQQQPGAAQQRQQGTTASLSFDEMQGMNVANARGNDIGTVRDVVIDRNQQMFVVVGYGGFLGIGEREVMLPLERVEFSGDRLVVPGMTDDQLRQQPQFQQQQGFQRPAANQRVNVRQGQQAGTQRAQ